MGQKHKLDNTLNMDYSSASVLKRQRSSLSQRPFTVGNSKKSASQSAYYQESAFPGLDVLDSLEEKEADEALAYLQSVRKQANGIPHVVKAPNHSVTDPCASDDTSRKHQAAGGLFKDGAYIAISDGSNTLDHVDLSPQEAFTKALILRFRAQKLLLRCLLSEKKKKKKKLNFQPSIGKVRKESSFISMVKTRKPKPSEICILSQSDTLRLLKLITPMIKLSVNIEQCVSEWIWALLCQLGDAGILNNDAISVVRELGKRAVLVSQSFYDEEVHLALDGDVNQENNDDSDAATDLQQEEPESVEIGSAALDATAAAELEDAEARALRVLAQKPSKTPSVHANVSTQATLDTIITIAGELYGQRDVLESRIFWTGEAGLGI